MQMKRFVVALLALLLAQVQVWRRMPMMPSAHASVVVVVAVAVRVEEGDQLPRMEGNKRREDMHPM